MPDTSSECRTRRRRRMVSKMTESKPRVEENTGTDGATLDIAVDKTEPLNSGLERLPSGMIAITRAYCPNGHNLVDATEAARFNKYSGLVLMAAGEHTTGKVILSPIHGDDTKFGESGFELGEVTQLTCPECGVEFPVIQPCGCTEGSNIVGLFLSDELEDGNQVAVCTAWGCLRSRIMDRFQVISKFE